MYTPDLHFDFTAESYTPDLHFDFTDSAVTGYAVVTLDDAQGLAICEYDSNVARKFAATFLVGSSDTVGTSISIHALSQQPVFNYINACEQQRAARTILIQVLADLQQPLFNVITVQAIGQDAPLLINDVFSTCNLTDFLTTDICAAVQNANGVYADIASIQDVLTLLMQDSHALNTDTLGQLVNRLCVNVPYSIKLSRRSCDKSQQAIPPAFGKRIHIDLPRPPPILPPEQNQYYSIPERTMYHIAHTISVVLLPDNREIAMDKLSISYDWDSYSWRFNGTLNRASDKDLFDLSTGESVKLSITINGYHWVVVVDELPETKEFGKNSISVTGKSLSSLLLEPWLVPNSYTAGSDMTVQQIANSLIPYDWTINWLTDTWLIPANTYSHTNQTIAQALKSIADNIGAVLVSSRNDQSFNMQKKYPIPPWHYYETGITPNLTIPDSAIKSISTRTKIQSPVNSVYVHGNQSGVLAWCRFNGTAGDVLTATQSNTLITDVTAARNLAEAILADKYTQPSVTSVTTYLGGDFPLAEIGQLVAVNDERATVNGVSIDVEFGKVRQMIGLGNQSTNLFSRFKRALPDQPLLVGQLVSTDGMTSIMTLIGGGVVSVRGTGISGKNYYTRNGIIESEAPQLEPFEIVI